MIAGFIAGASSARAQTPRRTLPDAVEDAQTPRHLDHQMHDLRVERFLNEPPDGPIKTFTLRGIKDSPPYLHDGRCLTLEDTVEFCNLVLQLGLSKPEKADLVAFMRAL